METLALILAVIALFLAHGKQRQIDRLKRQMQSLEKRFASSSPASEAAEPQAAPPYAANWRYMEPLDPLDEDRVAAQAETEAAPDLTMHGPPTPPWAIPEEVSQPAPFQKPRRPRPDFNLEKAIGVYLPVWGGAVMLLIAGFFLARMAADNGLLSPTLGVVACAVLAVVMLAGAFGARRLAIANHALIGAALASAAIGTLYATSFLSSAAFGLTSLFTGFMLSAGTAALSLTIALTFGKPVLAVGLLGGYLAPFFLVAGAPGDLVIHLYLAALLVAGAATGMRLNWNQLLVPLILVHFAWLAGMMLNHGPFGAGSLPTIVLLVATPLVIFALSQRWPAMPATGIDPLYTALILALVLLVLGCSLTDFSTLYLSGFAVLALASAAMTLWGRSRADYPTLIAVAGWVALLVLWRDPQPGPRLAMTAAMALAAGLPLFSRLLAGQNTRLLSVTLTALVTVTFISTMIDLDGWGGIRDLPYLWTLLALILAGAASAAASTFGRTAPEGDANVVRSVFAAAASAYLSLAIVAVVDPNYFALAAALQVLGLAIIYRRYALDSLLTVAGFYLAAYFGLLVISVADPLPISMLGRIQPYLPQMPPWDAPVSALLLPAIALLAAGTLLARLATRLLPKVLDGAGVVMLAGAATCLILPRLAPMELKDALVWSSLWGNVVLAIGLAALIAGKRLSRLGLLGTGAVVMAGMLALIVAYVGLPAYQFWPAWHVPGLPLLNASITGLILPGLFALAIARGLREAPGQGQYLRWLAAVVGGGLVLTGLLIDIRHLFHPDLLQGPSGLVERYSYSAGMLAMAFSALILGTRLDSQPLRYGSLAIMLATVAKVFLFDTSGLEGIWRVASYLAMGLALLATSWFYGRYVFGRGPRTSEAEL